jgi:tRNA (guanine-N7-)-methyltransferase
VNAPARERAFYGRRKGHALHSRQAALFDSLLPKLAIDLAVAAPRDLRALFPLPVMETRLEIGFGGAEHLIAQAAAHPHVGFFGCEPFVNGMAKALAAIDAYSLTNIRLHHGDVLPLLDWLPGACLARVDLLYPDPWPKRRHWKRRFVNDDNIGRLARVLQPAGEFRFATDWPAYAAWTLERLLRAPAFVPIAQAADAWRQPWPEYSATRYETKARREGRVPFYFTFRRK